jgi:hypothetical protein
MYMAVNACDMQERGGARLHSKLPAGARLHSSRVTGRNADIGRPSSGSKKQRVAADEAAAPEVIHGQPALLSQHNKLQKREGARDVRGMLMAHEEMRRELRGIMTWSGAMQAQSSRRTSTLASQRAT